MPKISVILPVYNAEKYIERSLLSLLSQSLEDIEIIIIDDGSTDSSLSIIHNLTNLYSNDKNIVHIISRENKGVARTRAEGIKLATGDYIIHLDSDDWVNPNWLKVMYDIASKDNCDMVICDYTEIYINKEKRIFQKCSTQKKENIESLLLGQISNTNWDKLIKASIIKENNISFIEDVDMGEDFLFTLKSFFYSSKVSYISKSLYNYNKTNQNSLTYSYTEKSLNDIVKIVNMAEVFLNEEKYLIKVKESFDLFKINVRTLYVINKSNDRDYINKGINIYPETDYLVSHHQTPTIFKIIFISNKFKLGFLNIFIKKLYLIYLRTKN